MQRLTFINGKGKEIDFTSGDYGITDWSGFASDELNIQSQKVPFHSGSVFLDALLEEREISITLAINDDKDLEKRYRLRRELISTLNATLGEGVLIYENDYIQKQIKALPRIPVFANKNANEGGTCKADISFHCCNPFWEDITNTKVYISGGSTVKIENYGDVKTPISFTYFGEDNSFIVRNKTNGDEIVFDNKTGDNIIGVSLDSGNKVVKQKVAKVTNKTVSNMADSGIFYNDKMYFFLNDTVEIHDGEEVESYKMNVANIVLVRECKGIMWCRYEIEENNFGFAKSTNGYEWTELNGIESNFEWYDVYLADDNKYYLATGYNSYMYESTDALNFIESALEGVTYFNHTWYKADYNAELQIPTLYYSTDNRVTWNVLDTSAEYKTTGIIPWRTSDSLYIFDYTIYTQACYRVEGGSHFEYIGNNTETFAYACVAETPRGKLYGGGGNSGSGIGNYDVNKNVYIIYNTGTDVDSIYYDTTSATLWAICRDKSIVRSKDMLIFETLPKGLYIQQVATNGDYYLLTDETNKLYRTKNFIESEVISENCPHLNSLIYSEGEFVGVNDDYVIIYNGNTLVKKEIPDINGKEIIKKNGVYYINTENDLQTTTDFETFNVLFNDPVDDIFLTDAGIGFIASELGSSAVYEARGELSYNKIVSKSYIINRGAVALGANYVCYATDNKIYTGSEWNDVSVLIETDTEIKDVMWSNSLNMLVALTEDKLYFFTKIKGTEINIKGISLAESYEGVLVTGFNLYLAQIIEQNNLISSLTSRLKLDLDSGTNEIEFAGGVNSNIAIEYRNRYIGV